jgi:hypothetical protein
LKYIGYEEEIVKFECPELQTQDSIVANSGQHCKNRITLQTQDSIVKTEQHCKNRTALLHFINYWQKKDREEKKVNQEKSWWQLSTTLNTDSI